MRLRVVMHGNRAETGGTPRSEAPGLTVTRIPASRGYGDGAYFASRLRDVLAVCPKTVEVKGKRLAERVIDLVTDFARRDVARNIRRIDRLVSGPRLIDNRILSHQASSKPACRRMLLRVLGCVSSLRCPDTVTKPRLVGFAYWRWLRCVRSSCHPACSIRLISDEAALSIGEFSFKVVVLPRLTVLPLKVVKKLLSFAQAGGLLLYLDQLPQGSTDNGMNDPAMNHMVEKLRRMPNVKHSTLEELPQFISQTAPPQVAFEKGEFPMLQSHRRIDGRDYFWLVNNSEEPKNCRLRIRDVQGQCSIWNCENGEIRTVASESLPEGDILIDAAFEPCEAFWLVVDPQTKMGAASKGTTR